MTPHQTLAVAVRLFAIVFAIYIVRELLAFYVSAHERGGPYAFSFWLFSGSSREQLRADCFLCLVIRQPNLRLPIFGLPRAQA